MALLHRPAVGDVLAYFYTFECFVPAQVREASTRITLCFRGNLACTAVVGGLYCCAPASFAMSRRLALGLDVKDISSVVSPCVAPPYSQDLTEVGA